MSNPTVTINLVVLNGEKYIRHCLNGILAQTYPHELLEFNILDNGSLDKTKSIIGNWKLEIGNSSFAAFNFIESEQNLGMWPGQEELLKYSNGKYILAVAVDVILDKDFIKNAVEIMEGDEKIGALQAKIYKFDLRPTLAEITPEARPQRFSEVEPQKMFDTCGFQIFRSRRVINIGHGEIDIGQFNEQKEIFGVEGACPFFRREALENCRIEVRPQNPSEVGPRGLSTEIFDHDYFWYGDDLDLVWRMRLFGWKQVFAPSVIAWHDRQTTKSLKKNWFDYILRVLIRHQIPIKKRRLDWRNIRFTIIKNDHIINILKDLPYVLAREVAVFGYALLFEPEIFLEVPNFLKLVPRMLKKRKEIMKKALASPKEMNRWFQP